MYCKRCGKVIADDSTFCRYCGTVQDTEETVEVEEHFDFLDAPTQPKKRRMTTNRRRTKKKLSVVVVCVVLAAVILVGALLLLPREKSAAQIAKLSESVLMLYAYDADHELFATGSGFVAFDDSTLVTNYHVIEGAYYVEANSDDGVQYAIEGVVYCDPDMDIAILSFEQPTGLPVLPIADSDEVKVGDTIYAIGSPEGLKNTVSSGIVSAIRDENGYTDLQISAPISHGSSGGALLDAKGRVIGITYAGYDDGQNLNFAIPSAEFMHVERGEVESFAMAQMESRTIGNSISNYYGGAYAVEYGEYIFHAFYEDGIRRYNRLTGETDIVEGINGSCLSAYDGKLYCLTDENGIASYDIATGECEQNILIAYSALPNVEIEKFYITPHGYTLVYDKGIVQLDFANKVLGQFETRARTLLDDTTLVGCGGAMLYFFSLTSLTEEVENMDFNMIDVVPCDTGDMYLQYAMNAVKEQTYYWSWKDEYELVRSYVDCGYYIKYNRVEGEKETIAVGELLLTDIIAVDKSVTQGVGTIDDLLIISQRFDPEDNSFIGTYAVAGQEVTRIYKLSTDVFQIVGGDVVYCRAGNGFCFNLNLTTGETETLEK